MKTLLKKLGRIAADIEKDLGTLTFFGLLHRADSPDTWELIVASSALPAQKFQAITYVAKFVKKSLNIKEIVRLARIVAVPPETPIVQQLLEESLPSGRMSVPIDPRFDRAYVIVPRATVLTAAAK